MPDTAASPDHARRADALAATIIAASPRPMLVFDPVADLILHANPAAGRLFGRRCSPRAG